MIGANEIYINPWLHHQKKKALLIKRVEDFNLLLLKLNILFASIWCIYWESGYFFRDIDSRQEDFLDPFRVSETPILLKTYEVKFLKWKASANKYADNSRSNLLFYNYFSVFFETNVSCHNL